MTDYIIVTIIEEVVQISIMKQGYFSIFLIVSTFTAIGDHTLFQSDVPLKKQNYDELELINTQRLLKKDCTDVTLLKRKPNH